MEFLGPGFRRGKIGDFVVAIGSAPLGPVLRGGAKAEGNGDDGGSEGNQVFNILHGVSFVGTDGGYLTAPELLLASKSSVGSILFRCPFLILIVILILMSISKKR